MSEEIGVNKTYISFECIFCHYWYFLEIHFRFDPKLCNDCHDLMQKVMSFIDVAIVSDKGNVCGIHFWYMNKDEAKSSLKNSDLIEKSGIL